MDSGEGQEPFGVGTAENRELLAEGKVLQGEVRAGAHQGAQGSEEGDEDGQHGVFCRDPRLSRRSSLLQRDGCDFGEAQAASAARISVLD